ncbi:MAG: aldehyde dehydrogenase family protein, partial [Solirubrobacteraceae bacterium]
IVTAVADRAQQIRVGDPTDPGVELGPLIRPEHHERVLDYIASARVEGARVLAGGERPPGLPDGNFLQATVIADVTKDMRVFQEEIFGPVLVAMPFSDEADAIRLANATPYGLAAYVWTNDIRRAHRVAHAIDTGMCWINSQNVRDLRTPFGGVKASGIGREGGDYAFDFYCETEIVHVALGSHHIPRLGLGDED